MKYSRELLLNDQVDGDGIGEGDGGFETSASDGAGVSADADDGDKESAELLIPISATDDMLKLRRRAGEPVRGLEARGSAETDLPSSGLLMGMGADAASSPVDDCDDDDDATAEPPSLLAERERRRYSARLIDAAAGGSGTGAARVGAGLFCVCEGLILPKEAVAVVLLGTDSTGGSMSPRSDSRASAEK
jgi:hypothetical protein